MMKTFLLFVVIPLCFCKSETIDDSCDELYSNRSFVIDYDHDVFLKDGKPFQYMSGELHYFRIPRAYWRDRMQKYRAAGLNAITTPVEWCTHEPCPGEYNFDGEADIGHFLQLATDENLLVILRCQAIMNVHREFGGLPPWLLTLYPNLTDPVHSDPDFRHEVEKWIDKLFSKITKYLYGNGGPIIMVQMELGQCNKKYQIFSRDLLKKHVRDAAVLFALFLPQCGPIPGDVYTAFTITTPGSNVKEQYRAMRKYYPRGPLINSDFWVGAESHWKEKASPLPDMKAIIMTTRELLDLKVNFNFYMFAGGTNFGFKNGAKVEKPPGEDSRRIRLVLTSYDYGAPIDEGGDYTLKYHAIRNLLSEYNEVQLPDPPNPSPKGDYGKVRLQSALSIFNTTFIKDKIVVNAKKPKFFHELNVKYGYVLYQTKVPDDALPLQDLFLMGVRDRAIIFLNKDPVTVIYRRVADDTITLHHAARKTLSILIENQGRYSHDHAHLMWANIKGFHSPAMGGYYLNNWTMTGLPFRNIAWVHDLPKPTEEINPPALYVGELILPTHERPRDTFVDLTGWGKGVIFINDFNIGRYWPSAGPQVTLYVPGCYLRANPQKNTIVVFETDHTPKNKEIIFRNKAILR